MDELETDLGVTQLAGQSNRARLWMRWSSDSEEWKSTAQQIQMATSSLRAERRLLVERHGHDPDRSPEETELINQLSFEIHSIQKSILISNGTKLILAIIGMMLLQ